MTEFQEAPMSEQRLCKQGERGSTLQEMVQAGCKAGLAGCLWGGQWDPECQGLKWEQGGELTLVPRNKSPGPRPSCLVHLHLEKPLNTRGLRKALGTACGPEQAVRF